MVVPLFDNTVSECHIRLLQEEVLYAARLEWSFRGEAIPCRCGLPPQKYLRLSHIWAMGLVAPYFVVTHRHAWSHQTLKNHCIKNLHCMHNFANSTGETSVFTFRFSLQHQINVDLNFYLLPLLSRSDDSSCLPTVLENDEMDFFLIG